MTCLQICLCCREEGQWDWRDVDRTSSAENEGTRIVVVLKDLQAYGLGGLAPDLVTREELAASIALAEVSVFDGQWL